MIPINYLAILLCGISNMVIGFLWYSKMLFADSWMKMSGITKADIDKSKKDMPMVYGTSFLLSLLQAYVLAHIIYYMEASNMVQGAITGFWVWLGFIFTTMAVSGMYEGKRKKLILINSGYQLVVMIVMGIILTSL